ncbi:HelD family protein [Micromonospora sp. NPDC092111]|uniref:HelD family protein n=1 Tax=Micromonospora sp. NPDC092111 TaxID=3364289 RepID=UPI0037FB2B04
MGTHEQVAAEQVTITACYARLDAEAAMARAAFSGTPTALLCRRLRDLAAAEDGLVFGRIDHADGTVLHIGRRGLRVDGEPLLIDWRAPAAAPFYAATAARPMGLRRRRHLRLAGRRLSGVTDEILDGSPPTDADVPGDGPLAEALSAPRAGRMRDAVTTLQAEQDAVVRSPYRGVTVVQGGPGTGKTVVALHRAAYVLFAFPVAGRGVLVVGPDARFLDYISQVLPSLGENDVRLVTRSEVAGPAPGLPDPPAVALLKGRGEMAAGLAAWVERRRPVAGPVTLPAGAEWIKLGGAAVAEALAAARGLPHNPGRRVFRDHLVAELAREQERQTASRLARFDAEVAAATGLDLDEAVAADLRSLGLEDAPRAVDPEPADPAALRADPRLHAAVDAIWPPLTAAEVVAGLLADPTAHLPADFAALRRSPGTPWRTADRVLLDEAAELVDGPPAEAYGHVVVDEAQELTEMDWRAVLRRAPARSMTVVGDFAQAGPGSTVTGWRQAVGDRFELSTLTVNYRTTAEILAFSRDLLAEIAPEQPPSRSLRHGAQPRTRNLPAEFTAGPGTVICADEAVAELAATGAHVVPVSAVRGLEFDEVLVVDPDRIVAARPSGRRDLYVALTRATHRLTVLVAVDAGRTGEAVHTRDRPGRPA